MCRKHFKYDIKLKDRNNPNNKEKDCFSFLINDTTKDI